MNFYPILGFFTIFVLCSPVLSRPQQQSRFFGGLFGGGNNNNNFNNNNNNFNNNNNNNNNNNYNNRNNGPGLAEIGAGAGLAGAGIFAIKNIAEGNDEIRLKPTFGLNFNPNSGRIVPQFGVNAQVGNGPLAPQIGIGGQYDGKNLNPVVTGGVGIGNGGLLGGQGNTGFVLGPNGPQATVGGGVTLGDFSLGRPLQGFGRRRRSVSPIYYYYI